MNEQTNERANKTKNENSKPLLMKIFVGRSIGEELENRGSVEEKNSSSGREEEEGVDLGAAAA